MMTLTGCFSPRWGAAACSHNLSKSLVDINGADGIYLKNFRTVRHMRRHACCVDNGLDISETGSILRKLVDRLSVTCVAGECLSLHTESLEFINCPLQLGHRATDQNYMLILTNKLCSF